MAGMSLVKLVTHKPWRVKIMKYTPFVNAVNYSSFAEKKKSLTYTIFFYLKVY